MMLRCWRWTASSTICRSSCDSASFVFLWCCLTGFHTQIYVESHLSNTATKFYGELTQQMIKMGDSPGSDNGTGFFQTLASLKIREFYEKLSGVEVEVEAPAKVAA